MKEEIYKKIIAKKEFSFLPKRDVEKIYAIFDKKEFSEEDKISLTRDLLRKVYFAFGSLKLLNINIVAKKSCDEILKKHISTRERFDFYNQLYSKIFLKKEKNYSIFDFGAGINGLSYYILKKYLNNFEYFAFEAVGQLVDLQNYFFKKEKIKNAVAVFGSLFDLDSLKSLIKNSSGTKIVFLFKTLDSLERVEKNYSKKLLREIVPLVDRVIVSFATQSLISKKRFNVKRYWFENFVSAQNWKILEDFVLGGERYILFSR